MKSPLSKNSFKRIIHVTAAIIVALLLISAIVNLLVVRSHYKNYENEQIREQLKNKTLILGKQLRLSVALSLPHLEKKYAQIYHKEPWRCH